MTAITINRATVEQALEAMRCAVPTGKITLYEWDKAMADLRAALAQQRLTDVQQEMERSIESLKAALAQQAEPVEPVAEARYDGTLHWLEPHGVGLHRIQGPLYTAPPQRKPLMEEEVFSIFRTSGSPVAFARAIEHAHGIKE